MKQIFVWRQVLVVCLLAIAAIGEPTDDYRAPYDYNGDGRSDLAVYDPADSVWHILSDWNLDSDEWGDVLLLNFNWGPADAIIVEGDFDGDGSADLAKYDPATAKWYAHSLASGTLLSGNVQWGFWGARPVPADYNGDGKTDLAVYHRESGDWWIANGTNTQEYVRVNWGYAMMRPVPCDYNGDGKADLAVYDELRGRWYITTLQGQVLGWDIPWGFTGVIPVPGDYNGDGKADLAVYHLATGNWYIRTLDGQILAMGERWGFDGAVPMPGDYNGDGRTDLAVYDAAAGSWYIRTLDGHVLAWAKKWGYDSAFPLPRASLAGSVNFREGPVTGPAPLAGEWVGHYYLETVERVPTRYGHEPFFADVQHIRNYVSIQTTRPAVGGFLAGSIDQVGNMVLVDRYDDETWTTPFGPAQYGRMKVYDFLFRPVPGVVSVLQVFDLVRY